MSPTQAGAVMGLLVGCLVAHELLARVWMPWAVPNLTLVGLLLVVGRTPQRWVGCSVVAGLATMVWAVREPWMPLLSCVGWAGLVAVISRMWDVADLRMQSLMAGLASLCVSWVQVWASHLPPGPLAGWIGIHVAMTALSIPCLIWLVGRRGGPRVARRHRPRRGLR